MYLNTRSILDMGNKLGVKVKFKKAADIKNIIKLHKSGESK